MRRSLLLAAVLIAGCGNADGDHALAQASHAPIAAAAAAPPAPWTSDERVRAYGIVARAFASPAFDHAGLLVVGADGATIFARNATTPLLPASTLKLLIAATALDALGPAQRLDTSFESSEPPDDTGTVQGPLYLVGGGDPTLTSEELRGGVGVLARLGVRRIEGGLVVDASAFSGPEQNPAWDADDLTYDYASGASAISLNENVAEFRVTPGAPGEPARVEVRPPNQAVSFSGTITTSEGYSDVSIVRDPPAQGPAANVNVFAVGGRIAAGEAQSFYKPVSDIPAYVGGAVAAMLAERGILLQGPVSTGAAPFAAQALWLHQSVPMAALLRVMLVFSDNHIAEQLLHIVGFSLYHAGTNAAGIRAERAYLARNDIPAAGMRVVDGSGLSPQNRVTPLLLARVLNAALHGRDADPFLHALPLVGMEGTVRQHHLFGGLGRVRAKSGHIENVNALAGTVQSRRHGRLVFAFLVNGPFADADAITEGTDRALDALAAL